MFYLINFFKVSLSNPFKSLLFFFTTTVLIMLTSQFRSLDHYANIITPKKQLLSHMQVLIKKRENISRISRRMKNLPGINSVKLVDQKIIEQRVKSITANIGLIEDSNLLINDYNGLKITFKHKTLATSKKLIKEYLVRLVGEDNIFVGPIISPQIKVSVKKPALKLLWKEITITATALLCFIFFLLLNNAIRKHSYYIEQFQRRKNSAIKTMMSAFGIIMVPIILTLFILLPKTSSIQNVTITVIAAIFCIAIFNSKKVTWQN